jgi:hypothetical protein
MFDESPPWEAMRNNTCFADHCARGRRVDRVRSLAAQLTDRLRWGGHLPNPLIFCANGDFRRCVGDLLS